MVLQEMYGMQVKVEHKRQGGVVLVALSEPHLQEVLDMEELVVAMLAEVEVVIMEVEVAPEIN
jgi:hypothetical protein